MIRARWRRRWTCCWATRRCAAAWARRARVRDLGLFTPARVAQDVENVYHRWLSERRGTAA